MWRLEKIIAMNSDTPAKVVSREDADFVELVSELKQLKSPELSTELKEITVDLVDRILEELKKIESQLIQLRITKVLCKTLKKTERKIPVGDNTPVIRRSVENRSCE